MEQLLLHLFGDYITQTHWMAAKKRQSFMVASLHAFVYSLPFLLITNWKAVVVIGVTHAVIDHCALARYVIFARNWVTQPSLKWKDCSKTGFEEQVPVWLSTWLLIIADNTLHLIINFLAIRYL